MRIIQAQKARFAILLVAFLGALAACTAPAMAAAVNVTSATPAARDAMAYSNFTMAMAFSGGSTPRSVTVDLPKGQLGALANAATCTVANWQNDNCNANTQLGTISTEVTARAAATFGAPINLTASGGMYRLPATGNEVGRFGLTVASSLSQTMYIQGTFKLRNDGTYAIRAEVPTIPNTAKVSFFGLGLGDANITINEMTLVMYGKVGNNTGASGLGFFFNPAECVLATTVVTYTAHDNSTASGSAGYTPTNCAGAPFDPTVAFGPASAAATPTAFNVNVTQPYVATAAKVNAPFRDVTLTLPPGVQLTGATNSDGTLVACTDAQFNVTQNTPSSCPAGSRIGTVAMDSPLIGTIPGEVFLAQPASPVGANDLVRLFVVAQLGTAADHVRVKFPAAVSIDPATGRLITTLTGLPAQPVRSFSFTFRDGTAPATRNPRTCATYVGNGSLVSYASPTAVARSGNYVVNANCGTAGRFRPTIGMVQTPNRAGASATGVTTIELPVGDEAFTSVTASLPAGLLANIAGVPRCTAAQAAAETCPAASRVGSVLDLAGQSSVPGTFTGDIFLTDAPDASSIAGLQIKVPVQVGPIVIDDLVIQARIRLRTDYGIDVISTVPDTVRALQLDQQRLRLTFDRANFMTNPPLCTGNAITGAFGSAQGSTATDTSAVTITGCASMAFAPTISFTAGTPSASGASSLTTTVSLPAGEQSPPKTITVTLPDEVSLSPSADSSGGLTGCTDVQFAKATFADPTCPAASAVGTVTIQTPSVGALTGSAYLGTAPAGHTARVFLDATSTTFGDQARVKLEGLLDVDAATGRTSVVFDGIPPVAFTSFALTLRGGSNPVLSMPRTCGTYPGSATMVPHSGATASPAGALSITADCADATSFAPAMSAATAPTQAGADTTLTTTISVPERHRFLRRLALGLPAGLLAKVDGAPRCSVAAANAGACPATTRIGSVEARAGQGAAPGTFAGSLYLTDAPAPGDVVGIAVDLPAVVGPVDLGKVTTIASVKLRPSDDGLDVSADVPTSVRGVPLFLRSLRLTIDKAGFMTNPPTCAASTITSTLTSVGGSTASPSSPFQATGCAALGLDPTVSFTGAPARAAGASAFTTQITAPASTPGAEQGALRRAVVDLPAGVSLSPSIDSGATNLAGCTAAQFDRATFADPTCAATSVIGTVQIDVPQVGVLTGDAYLAQTAPSGAVAGLFLDATSATFGDAVRVKLDGRVDVDATTGRTTATFDDLPAIAFTRFRLALRGGTNPVISMPRTCGTPAGSAALTPHTGAAIARTGTLTVDQNCGDDTSFGAAGTVALSDRRAGQDTSLTTTVTVPSGHRELRKVELSLPAGLLANIDGKPRCSIADANAGTCTAATQIGTIVATAGQGTVPGTFPGKAYLVDAPSDDDIVGIGLSIPVKAGPVDLGLVNVIADVRLRSDYGIDISAAVPTEVRGIPMYLRSLEIAITKPGFLFNPSTCGPKTATLALTSALYGTQRSTSTATDTVTITDCDSLAFTPALGFSATPARAGGAAAFTTALTLPATAQSALRSATVQLPAGVTLSPSIDSAATLTGCTAAQFDQTTPSVAPTCPAASKIGDAAITTSSVGELSGGVYLAASAPGHLARVFVDAASSSFPGARVKMSGDVDVDEATGLTTAVFRDAPEVPFTRFAITFRGGSAPALSMPRTCGTPSGSATLVSHAGGAPVDRTAALTIDQDCGNASQFAPTTTVTTSPTTAATATALTTTIAVPAGQQELRRVRLSLPAGLIAKIDGRPTCSLPAAAAGTCPANTRIGAITATAGQGDTPATFGGGSVYLTAAPTPADLVGLAIALPVAVGSAGGTPIVDLGTVTAQGAVRLRRDYGIDIAFDDVPTTVKGIPMALRQLTLRIDESGFMVNPATCSGNAVTGTLGSLGGSTAPVAGALTVTDCAAMPFDPTVAFSASPGRASGPAAFTTRLSLPATAGAPLAKAVVTLPAGASLSASANAQGDLAGCTDAAFSQATWNDPTCPAPSKIGTVTIQTPSVGALTGDAYLAATAPSGAIARVFLDASSSAYADRVRVKVEGTIAVDPATGTTVATFDGLPPVAFTTFDLTLRGGAAPVLSLPRTCGTFPGSAVLTSQGATVANRSGTLSLTQDCPAADQFSPTVDFALAPSGAGEAGKLTTTITVPGGDQELSRIKLDLPEGLTAKLKGAARCSITDALAGACAADTELGTAVAKVGVAGVPFTENGGKVYLTEGRNGNVAGMAIVLPAKVGPIDLGTVVTIADVQLRSPDLALQISADVPTSVRGVRLDLRELALAITKDDFLVNPSSCGTLTGTARFTSKGDVNAGDDATITVPAASCAAQSFDPRIAFTAGNPKPGEASDFTTTVTLTDGPGAESPFESVAVRLPAGMSLSASANARGDLAACTDAQFHQDDLSVASTCPAGAEIGTATFETELVGDLRGKAYLAPATSGNLARVFLETTATDVPNLTVRVVGEIEVNETTGATDAVFASVPAIPVTTFSVTFRGGDAPTLALPRLCGPAQGSGTFVPVNGGGQQVRDASLALSTADCPDPAAFAPAVALSRSKTAAGRAMAFTTTVDVPAKQQELSSLKMVLPAGLLGTISSIPACSRADGDAGTCSADAKVGTVTAQVGVASAPFTVTGSAYLVQGDRDAIARLSIVLPAKVGPIDLGTVVTVADLKLRGDYGLDITAPSIPTTVKGVRLDLHRFSLAIDRPDFMVNQVSCAAATGRTTVGSAQGGSQVREQALTADSCDQLELNASLAYAAAPASPSTASAVTTSIRAGVSGGGALDAMRSVRVTMPEGVSLSPSAGARGDLAECTPGAFGAADITVDAACPAGSVVGRVTISSPMVGTLTGDAYLGAKPDGHFAGIYLQAKAADFPSLRVKIAGSLDVDRATGRLTAAFTELPLVQVSAIDLQLRGGDAPVLGLPRTCGTFGADVNILRHGGGTSDATGALVLDTGCPDPGAFAPTVAMAQSSTQAGADTALSTVITVPARHQELRSLDLAMPAGLLGRLTVAPKCPLADARAGACGDASLIGSAKAKVGVASAPFTVTGKVFLTEGFDGSIAGLMFALPAKVGPIDLGTVVTMAQLKITGNDVRLGITAADIPTRVQGIPLSIGELTIGIDRPGMVLNGTTCGEGTAVGSFASAQGGTATGNAGLRTTGCENLGWRPSFGVGFTGAAADLKKAGHPTLSTVIEQTEGQGNLRTADVTLPEGVVADLTNINKRQCASAGAAFAGTCAEASKVGVAEIRTSALPDPVDATIFLVDLPTESLPGLAISVRDQITFDVVGTTKLDKSGRLVANFDGLPDTPISKMTLVFNGGSGGILQLATDACTTGTKTDATLTAQHGAKKAFVLPVTCNGQTTALAAGGGGAAGRALATASFKPSGSSSALTFALSNPNGISKIVLRMPKGAIFTKKAAKLVKLSLTGAKARTVVVNGERRMAISIKPIVAGQKVTKVKFKLPKKAIKINVKVRKVLENEKTSKKKKQALLTKLLKPSVTLTDGAGASTAVKITTKVAAK